MRVGSSLFNCFIRELTITIEHEENFSCPVLCLATRKKSFNIISYQNNEIIVKTLNNDEF